ncbi:MAG: efflux RND transporter periplasmic adaptor subunit [Proteobacteria bacterium]|nr:efflux RND transporter periplasmic adaptor subunit [Pseudomonadota bacterium]
MKILLVNSVILGSAVIWPITASWQQAGHETSRLTHEILTSFTDTTSPDEYLTSPIKIDEVVKTVMATGSLIPSLNVDVGSVLSGQIFKLNVDFNDKVVKGQVLAELDDRSFKLAVDANRAALDSAKADIKATAARIERADADLEQASAQRDVLAARVERAKSTFDIADREYKRKLWLQERNASPAAEVQDAQSRRDSAASALHESEAVLANQAGLIEAARADKRRAQAENASSKSAAEKIHAQLSSALVDLERTKIRSPVDGVIVGRNITEGQTLATGLEAKTLFNIAGDLEHMEINARVDESDIGKIKVGQDATFTVDAFPGRTFQAVVKQIRMAPQVVQNVVTYTVVLTADNPDYTLLPGMTVLAKIVVHRNPAATTVPLAALRFREHADGAAKSGEHPSSSLWVLGSDNRPRRVPVIRGDDNGTDVAVMSDGLKVGDRIVIGKNRLISSN